MTYTDIVDRLLNSYEWAHWGHSMRVQAADEIKQLRRQAAEIERLHEVIKGYDDRENTEIKRLRAEISAGEASVCGVIGGLEAEIAQLRAALDRANDPTVDAPILPVPRP